MDPVSRQVIVKIFKFPRARDSCQPQLPIGDGEIQAGTFTWGTRVAFPGQGGVPQQHLVAGAAQPVVPGQFLHERARHHDVRQLTEPRMFPGGDILLESREDKQVPVLPAGLPEVTQHHQKPRELGLLGGFAAADGHAVEFPGQGQQPGADLLDGQFPVCAEPPGVARHAARASQRAALRPDSGAGAESQVPHRVGQARDQHVVSSCQ